MQLLARFITIDLHLFNTLLLFRLLWVIHIWRLAAFPYVFIVYIICILLDIYVLYHPTSVFRCSSTYNTRFEVWFLVYISYSSVPFGAFLYILFRFVCIYDGGDFSSLFFLSYVIISSSCLQGFIVSTIKMRFRV